MGLLDRLFGSTSKTEAKGSSDDPDRRRVERLTQGDPSPGAVRGLHMTFAPGDWAGREDAIVYLRRLERDDWAVAYGLYVLGGTEAPDAVAARVFQQMKEEGREVQARQALASARGDLKAEGNAELLAFIDGKTATPAAEPKPAPKPVEEEPEDEEVFEDEEDLTEDDDVEVEGDDEEVGEDESADEPEEDDEPEVIEEEPAAEADDPEPEPEPEQVPEEPVVETVAQERATPREPEILAEEIEDPFEEPPAPDEVAAAEADALHDAEADPDVEVAPELEDALEEPHGAEPPAPDEMAEDETEGMAADRPPLATDAVATAAPAEGFTPAPASAQPSAPRPAFAAPPGFEPGSLTLRSLGAVEEDAEEYEQAGAASMAKLMRAEKAWREGDLEKAETLFQEILETDARTPGAAFGLAGVQAILGRSAAPAFPENVKDKTDEWASQLCPDWAALTQHERDLIHLAVEPVSSYLHRVVKAKCQVRIHPMDVRLTDLYPKRIQMRFDLPKGGSIGDVGLFSKEKCAHARLDLFLTLLPGRWDFGRAVGYALVDSFSGKKTTKAKQVARHVKEHFQQMEHAPTGLGTMEDTMAAAYEAILLKDAFGDAASVEAWPVFEEVGAVEFLRTLK